MMYRRQKWEIDPVSTLLEILAVVIEVHKEGVDFFRFQPFLRFWGDERRDLYKALAIIEFQPFLRFWRGGEVHLHARRGHRFQPFLRFWLGCYGHRRLRPVHSVSTLLEILGLACLVLVGF